MKTNSFVLLAFWMASVIPLISLPKPEPQFEDHVQEVMRAFRQKDTRALNEMIHPERGLMIVFRPGVFNNYYHFKEVDLNEPHPHYLPEITDSVDHQIAYESLPTFSCDEYVWNKTGLFCDTTSVDHLLSRTAQNRIRYDLGEVTDEEIQAFTDLENNSRKVVLADNVGRSLMFSLTPIDGKWYLTIIDLVRNDCST
ncbi:hypothetical protein [Flavilitoribacter nigricans]|uniref:Uncharacterized protein n=1 Tax=Flavilitoribacter nigricans (strain ATCC 23147 / DSM 23189 / NBRC 102662 / NCIMB 1420 / SS-2) TaxID=1122177 RepID=A0A2D0NBG6_FLAN2|nr:hypothetical protein [Flavilitoribacter nigricans]PHN05728.1 hypothetical protein CRP01_14725 [Flavilitoribacter nigricans DSM 23189 = NBRC 102662]